MRLLKVKARNFLRSTSEEIYINPESFILLESFTGELKSQDALTGTENVYTIIDGTKIHTTSISAPHLVLDTPLADIINTMSKGYQMLNAIREEAPPIENREITNQK